MTASKTVNATALQRMYDLLGQSLNGDMQDPVESELAMQHFPTTMYVDRNTIIRRDDGSLAMMAEIRTQFSGWVMPDAVKAVVIVEPRIKAYRLRAIHIGMALSPGGVPMQPPLAGNDDSDE